MVADAILEWQEDWDQDLPDSSPAEDYQALLRALDRTAGFGLFFVRCSELEEVAIIAQLQRDLAHKRWVQLQLQEPVRDFYRKVEQLPNREQIDVVCIQGLHHSIYEYEDAKRLSGWTSKDIHSYSWKGVPPVLSNINQQRERFRDNFPFCLVFFVPYFILQYFPHRAPDFFD
jgi:hypothetical protein